MLVNYKCKNCGCECGYDTKRDIITLKENATMNMFAGIFKLPVTELEEKLLDYIEKNNIEISKNEIVKTKKKFSFKKFKFVNVNTYRTFDKKFKVTYKFKITFLRCKLCTEKEILKEDIIEIVNVEDLKE